MRCLTLADALAERGGTALFLCRPLEGDLIGVIAERGHRVKALPALASGDFLAATKPAEWLGKDQAGDAMDCLVALDGEPRADWLVVDHYALDRGWEGRMRPVCTRLMVLDDLADRPHDCDLLLDPSLGRSDVDYADLLSPGAVQLLGPRHALLRPEFASHRAQSLARREAPVLGRILVTLGGMDSDNVTVRVLDALDDVALPEALEITVVMGANAPWLTAVRARAATMRRRTCVLAGVSNMAQLMTESDLAIGAAGSTAWERCCLGLPTLQLVLADNQKGVGAALASEGAAVSLLTVESVSSILAERIASGQVSQWLRDLSTAASKVVDGHGAVVVSSLMERCDA